MSDTTTARVEAEEQSIPPERRKELLTVVRESDGGWLDDAPEGQIDCRFTGPFGLPDGGPRWRGVNVGPREYAAGTQCLPVECSVVAGDIPSEWL